MSQTSTPALDKQFDKFEKRLPSAVARPTNWLRRPDAICFRIPAAIVLILGGIVGYLPVLGF